MRFKDTIGISYILKITEHEVRLKIDAALTPLGLTAAQYTALSCIEERSHVTNAEMARKCSVTPQTMNRILQNLERDGFVKKRPHPQHGLKLDFTLTTKAIKVICKAHTAVNAIEEEMIKGLSKVDLRKFNNSLKHCLTKLQKTKKF